MKIEYHLIRFLILPAILILNLANLRSLQYKLRPKQEPQEHNPKTPRSVKPKTEDDYSTFAA